MKERLLKYLLCPVCGEEFILLVENQFEKEVLTGHLMCKSCMAVYPIVNGIPRFVDLAESSPEQQVTANNFGKEWLIFDEVANHHEQQLKDWLAPVTDSFLRGKIVLEIGCGKGRHTKTIAQWGAQDIVAIDISIAVEAAYRNTKNLSNVHVIQADVYKMPLRPIFDYGFSVGVLHHLPDPRQGFLALVGKVKKGGSVSAWVYGRENNGWLVYLVTPIRRLVTARLPVWALYYVSLLPALIVWFFAKAVYRPIQRVSLPLHLPYEDYINYIAKFPFREIHHIVYDHLTAPTAFYLRRAEFAEWFDEIQANKVAISWHNRNSWRGFGILNNK